MSTPLQSTGRGGAGNIGHDTTQYTDAGIVREGVAGESVDSVYSSGRGGAGNAVNSPRVGPTGRRGSHDRIPEASLVKQDPAETYHYGRGGAANVVGPDGKAKYEKHDHPHHEGHKDKESIVDKAKHLLHLDKKKEDPAVSE